MMVVKYLELGTPRQSYVACGVQHWQLPPSGAVFSVSRVPFVWLLTSDGSWSRLSDILSQMISTRRSNTAFTLMFSLAEVSKNSKPTKKSMGKMLATSYFRGLRRENTYRLIINSNIFFIMLFYCIKLISWAYCFNNYIMYFYLF